MKLNIINAIKILLDKLLKQPEVKSTKPEIEICIDAGHGNYDWGLKSGDTYNKGYNGCLEKDINLELANRVAFLCARHNIGYIMTRWGDRYISLSERCKRANQTKAKLFLSIHCNYGKYNNWKGVETWHYENSKTSKGYAEKFQNQLEELKYTKARGIKDTNKFYVLKHTKMPAVLLELGFLSNQKDCEYLDNENNQMLVAVQIWKGIKQVLGVNHESFPKDFSVK